jgi:flagellar basal body rod protein FlgG
VDGLTAVVASGLRAKAEALEILANNMANAGSTGFKADRESYSTYFSAEALDGPEGSYPTFSPVTDRHWTDQSEGPSILTGDALDFTIVGPGFFVVETPNGPRCTRAGKFRLNPSGNLENSAGHTVRGRDGKGIKLDPRQEFSVDATGTFRQGGEIVGQLELVDFADKSKLAKAGATYFHYESASPYRVASPQVQQGRLEGANFHPAEAAVRLVAVMRQFEALQRALSLAGEMNRRTLEDVARVKE